MPSPDLLALLRGGPSAPRVGEDVLIYRPGEGQVAIAVGGAEGGAAAAEAWRLRADGLRVGDTVPRCRVTNSANISVPDASTTQLTFNTERYDNDAMHDNAVNPGRLTCRTAGAYLIFANLLWQTGAGNQRNLQALLNGSTPAVGADDRAPLGGALSTSQSWSGVWPLAVGDWVELWVRQDSGGALLLISTGAGSSPDFGMVRIG